MTKDYYKILGVNKNASKEDMKKAYKKLAKQYHPDISKEQDAEKKFKDINEAAGVLLDDEKRQRYDTYGTADGPQGFGGFGGSSSSGFNPQDFGINLDDLFEQFGFGGFGGSSSRSRKKSQQKDTSVYEEVEITLDDVYFGKEIELKINHDEKCSNCQGKGAENKNDIRTCSTCNGSGSIIENQRSILGIIRTQRTCPDCQGRGSKISNPCYKCSGSGTEKKKETLSIKIPKGVEDGVTLRVQNKGSFDSDTQSYGDLFLKIYVKKDKDLDVDGADLYKTLNINFVQAILGDEIEFVHFNKTLSLKIPEGTQSGTILRLKEKGLPYFNYNGQGNLYVKLNVEIPKTTTKEQKSILLDYAKTLKDKGFFKRVKDLFN